LAEALARIVLERCGAVPGFTRPSNRPPGKATPGA
jgi:hypothetical protein